MPEKSIDTFPITPYNLHQRFGSKRKKNEIFVFF